MIDFAITVDKAEMGAFNAQMNRLINVLGKEPKEAVRMGAIAMLKALQASTRKAPKVAKVSVDKSQRKRGVSNTAFIIHRFKQGRAFDVPLIAASLAEAKQSPRAKVFYAGLAKAQWGWSMQRLFPGKTPAPAVGFPQPKGALDTSATGTGRDYTVMVSNSLNYVTKAFKSSGKQDVNSALRRATAVMRGRIDQRLKGAMA